MHLIYIFLIAIANSMDNMAVRIAYIVGGIKVQLFKNILISFMAFVVSFSAALTGGILSKFLSSNVSSTISMLLLVFIGIRIISEPYLKDKDTCNADILNTKAISYKEAISIGIALAVDDIGGALSIGLIGYNPFIVGIAFFIVSFLIFLIGNYAIRPISKFNLGNRETIVSGIIMIAIGISQILF